jgi:hypothetical protein
MITLKLLFQKTTIIIKQLILLIITITLSVGIASTTYAGGGQAAKRQKQQEAKDAKEQDFLRNQGSDVALIYYNQQLHIQWLDLRSAVQHSFL